jgi:hypothetical protein
MTPFWLPQKASCVDPKSPCAVAPAAVNRPQSRPSVTSLVALPFGLVAFPPSSHPTLTLRIDSSKIKATTVPQDGPSHAPRPPYTSTRPYRNLPAPVLNPGDLPPFVWPVFIARSWFAIHLGGASDLSPKQSRFLLEMVDRYPPGQILLPLRLAVVISAPPCLYSTYSL